RVHGEDVPVRRVALGWRGAAELLGAEVAARVDGVLGQTDLVAAAGAGGQLGDRGRDVEEHPVPEPAAGRRVRVVAGDRVALRLGGSTAPGQVRRTVLPTGTHAVEYLRLAEGLAVGDVVTAHVERRDLGEPLVRELGPLAFGHAGEPPTNA